MKQRTICRREIALPTLRSLVVLLGAVTMGNAAEPSAVEIVAHRGASYDAPENTLPAFQLGWDQQADAVELDIMLSKDGQIVVIHDPNTKRLAGVDLPVVQQSFDELLKLDVGRWKEARWEGTRIPRLSEVLATIPKGKRLFIEIKSGVEILPELKRQLAAAGRPPAETAIIGFSDSTMAAAKREFPNLQVYWIVDGKPNAKTGKAIGAEMLIQQARSAGVDGLDLAAYDGIDRDFVGKVRQAGLKIAVWTVNDPVLARRMIDAGVESITTDRPGWMREQLKKSEYSPPVGK